MRYFKGCITLGTEHDIPLLQQVLYCGFVTQQQLWQFMVQGGHERRRECFNWRVRRLTDHGFLQRQALSGMSRSFVYSLTQDGASELIGLEQSCPGATAFFNRGQDHHGVRHALELNELRLALHRSDALARWTSELELRSRNEFSACGYAKDYDALMTLRVDGEERRVALEYERVAKNRNRYLEIVAAIESEKQVDRFLYLVPDYDLLLFLQSFFVLTKRMIYFGIASEFKRDLLATRVLSAKLTPGRLCDVLKV